MLELTGHDGFLFETANEGGVAGQFRADNLKCTQSIEADMHGLVNGTHAPLSDFGENLILAANNSAHSPFVSGGESAAVTRAMRVVRGKSRIAGRALLHAGKPPAADAPITIHSYGAIGEHALPRSRRAVAKAQALAPKATPPRADYFRDL